MRLQGLCAAALIGACSARALAGSGTVMPQPFSEADSLGGGEYDGRIELITGPMFSGKSTELLRRLKRYRSAGIPELLLKFSGDHRYEGGSLVQTHDRDSMAALQVARLADALAAAEAARVIGIDEGQFFDDLIPFAEEMANRGKVVIVAALDGTYQRLPFGSVTSLMPLCERVDKLSAICVHCARPAAFTKRLSLETELVSIGGADKYEAVCRRHYFERSSHYFRRQTDDSRL